MSGSSGVMVAGQWYRITCRSCRGTSSFPYRAGFVYVRCPACGAYTDVRNVESAVSNADVYAAEEAASIAAKTNGAVESVSRDLRVVEAECPDALTQLEATLDILEAEEGASSTADRMGAGHVGPGVQKAMEQWGFIRSFGDAVFGLVFGEPDLKIGNGCRLYFSRIPFMKVILLPPTASFILAPVLLISALILSIRGWMYNGLCDPSAHPDGSAAQAAAEGYAFHFKIIYISVTVAILFSLSALFTDPGYVFPDLAAKGPDRDGPESDHPMEIMRIANEDDESSAVEYETVNGVPVERRWCKVCNILRPMRASHCYICGLCVRHHDHHCHVTGTCIGERNTRQFLYFLVALTVALFNGCYLVLNYVWYISNGGFVNRVICVVTFLIMMLVTFAVAGLNIALMILITSNLTSRDRIKAATTKKREPNPFDKGLTGNVVHFFTKQLPTSEFADPNIIRDRFTKHSQRHLEV